MIQLLAESSSVDCGSTFLGIIIGIVGCLVIAGIHSSGMDDGRHAALKEQELRHKIEQELKENK